MGEAIPCPHPSKVEGLFDFFFSSCLALRPVQVFSSAPLRRQLIGLLPPFYQHLVRAWSQFDGGLAEGYLALDSSTATPRPLSQLNTHSTYVIGRRRITPEPHCVAKFLPLYGPLHWPQTWEQIHITSLDRAVVDLNWKITHGVLYTASRLVHRFGMANINPQCHCRADKESLEHLFFECRYSRILVGWVYFNLLGYDANARPFTVDELLFGFSQEAQAHPRCHHLDAAGGQAFFVVGAQ